MKPEVAHILENWPDRLADPDIVLKIVSGIMKKHNTGVQKDYFWDKELYRIALLESSGNRSRAAARLRIPVSTFESRVQRWGMK